jgi:chromatin structure-remodeling complex subunit RSC8
MSAPETATATPDVGTSDHPVKPEDGSDSENPTVDMERIMSSFQEKAKSYLIEQASHVVIPSFAKWFDMNEVHSIEKKLFPDFFPQDTQRKSVYKTPQAYRNMRDFMINAYRINPLEYLTITAIRRNVAGDVSSLIRIHQFLEKWGLINYQIDPRTKPTIVGPQYTGHFQITLDTPRGLVPLLPENSDVKLGESLPTPKPDDAEDQEEPVDQKAIPLNLEVRRNIYASGGNFDPKNAPKNIIQYFCNICGNESSEVRYHNLKSKSYANNPNVTMNSASVLCQTCYEQGLFPSNFQAADFLKLTKADEAKPGIWTEQETLLLLEAIEMFGSYDPANNSNPHMLLNSNANGQWDKIAEYVGTKNREQCLLKFIRLPIEDQYLPQVVKREEKVKGIDRKELIQDVVSHIVSSQQGVDTVRDNARKNKEELISDQTNIINQIIELTVEKVQVKLERVHELEKTLIETEKLLNNERKQVLYERWTHLEKINHFKKNHQDSLTPELNDLLSSLTIQSDIVEVEKAFSNGLKKPLDGSTMDIESADNNSDDRLPVSVAEPKMYQFWSA